ncbi:MAG: DNA polymerase Y family protein [Alphaproteobacteria bacterium]|nr:DNA polymerase Y family protein [Alphaproteobacteria bacterium]
MTGGTIVRMPVPRRILALWLPHLPAERPEAEHRATGTAPAPQPFAVWIAAGNRQLIAAANRPGRQAGVVPGQTLADARAIAAGLVTAPVDECADARTLRRLAAWCRRYSPWTATLGTYGPGIWLDITGCAHLFGGEESLCRTVVVDLARLGFTAHAGLAGTPGAAYALARYGWNGYSARSTATGPVIAPAGGEADALAPLPVAALRLDAAMVEGLGGLGLRRIGDLYPFAADAAGRAGLARRFPPELLGRLDAALGQMFEPISPALPRARHLTRFTAPEPVHDTQAVARIMGRLVAGLAPMLAREGLGARRLAFSAFRADGRRARVIVGTARPVAEAKTLARLLGFQLGRLDLGPGADGFVLEAPTVEPLRAVQGQLGPEAITGAPSDAETERQLAPLVEKLAARLGGDRVGRLALRPNHLPERAQSFERTGIGSPDAAPLPPLDAEAGPGPRRPARPLRLLASPVPVTAASREPEGPPAWFRWRGAHHRVARAEGPERIALDWWTLPGWQADGIGVPPGFDETVRDYWRVEDTAGARFWLYRAGLPHGGTPEHWFLHGVFP